MRPVSAGWGTMSPSWFAGGMGRSVKFLVGLGPMRILTELGCGQCPVRRYGVCHQVGGQDFERQFRQNVRIARWQAGDPIFRQGEPCGSVFTILSGWVLTYDGC
jgi:hypothetical protein